MNNPKLQSEIDSRCPCFAMPTSECQCQKSNCEQMLEAIKSAYSWLSHAHQLMISQAITSESEDSEWPINLADSLHYCGEVLSELDTE
jgi:hypothetical protein